MHVATYQAIYALCKRTVRVLQALLLNPGRSCDRAVVVVVVAAAAAAAAARAELGWRVVVAFRYCELGDERQARRDVS
eukprot:4429358-Pleurochrysis_carterae.AAC.2